MIRVELEKALQSRQERNEINKSKNVFFEGIIICYPELPDLALYPYDKQYADIFSNLLKKEFFKCPTYRWLNIVISQNMDDAIKHSFATDDSYIIGISTINYEKYKTLLEKEKESMVLNAIIEGLYDVAKLDKLNFSMLDAVTKRVKEQGLNIELHHATVKNNKYIVNITYFVRSEEGLCPIYLNLITKKTNQLNRIKIGDAAIDQIWLWLYSISITTNSIKTEPCWRRGENLEIYLYNLPLELEFSINEIIEKSL
jgi:hypothetical protein